MGKMNSAALLSIVSLSLGHQVKYPNQGVYPDVMATLN